jgi:hypothetical protein
VGAERAGLPKTLSAVVFWGAAWTLSRGTPRTVTVSNLETAQLSTEPASVVGWRRGEGAKRWTGNLQGL